MILQLSEIFIPLPDKVIYSAEELYALELKPSFIQKMTVYFNLSYVKNKIGEGNLCFAENKELRPEFRMTFNKADVVKKVFIYLSKERVNVMQDKLVFTEHFFTP